MCHQHMHHPDQKQPETTGDERVEIVDLDAARHESQAQPGTGRAQQTPYRLPQRCAFLRRRRVQVSVTSMILLTALAILLGVSGGFSWLAARISPTPSPSPVIRRPYFQYSTKSRPQQDGIACLINAAWSPDNRQVAALGYSNYCPAYQSEPPPGLVNLYNAASHKLVEQVHIDSIVEAALKQSLAAKTNTLVIQYEWAHWSPDGQEMAVPFFAFKASGETDAGLLLLSNRGQRILLQQVHPTNQLITYPYYFGWDLKSGTVNTVYNEAITPISATSFITIQSAPAYTWGANGVLKPSSVTSSNSDAIGNPDGGATFTIWQPGSASKYTQSIGSPAHLISGNTWSTTFMSWSPDGRYLIDQAVTSARFVIPHQTPPSSGDLVALKLDQLATLSVRDKALARILAALPASNQSRSTIGVAWRPDGRELATFNGGFIDLYDCATGRELGRLTPSNIPVGLSGNDTLAWSPDGSRLLLSSTAWGILNIWEPGQLPG